MWLVSAHGEVWSALADDDVIEELAAEQVAAGDEADGEADVRGGGRGVAGGVVVDDGDAVRAEQLGVAEDEARIDVDAGEEAPERCSLVLSGTGTVPGTVPVGG